MNTPEDDQGTDLEVSRQTIELEVQDRLPIEKVAQCLEGNQKLGRDPIAPVFDCLIGCGAGFGVRDGGLPEPEVGEFVGKREHLCGLGIGAVNEDQRRQRVRQSEAAKLLRVEAAAVVAPHDTADHDQYTECVSLLDEASQRLGPGGVPPALLQVDSESVAHAGSDFDDIVFQAGGADEREFPMAH